MSKEIYLGSEARDALREGIDSLANVVKVTFGPKGRNVLLGKPYGPPAITKDGVTVAKEVDLTSPAANMGAQMAKEVASVTASATGDGTTTASILAQHIMSAGLKNVTAGADPRELKKGIDLAVKEVVAHLKEQSKQIGSDFHFIEEVATIAANGDAIIGKLIARAMEQVGKDGVIIAEEATGIETSMKVVEGLKIDRGYLSPYFITDAEKALVELVEPYLLFYDGKIATLKDLLPILEAAAKPSNCLLIIAEDFTEEVLTTLVINKIKGTLNIAAIKTPGFGVLRKESLEDMAVLTGGRVLSEEKGDLLENVALTDLGRAEKIIIDVTHTTLVNGKGDKGDIDKLITQIKRKINRVNSEGEEDQIRERLAKISGGVAILSVGAYTEFEMNEKKDRVEDALNATKAAVEEGIVPGGGVAYIRSIPILEHLKGDNRDQTTGINIIRRALEQPLRQIVQNAGRESALIVEIVKSGRDDYGYNAQNGKLENLFQSGVIDPTKVTRVALENAASIVGLLLITECVIFEKSVVEETHR